MQEVKSGNDGYGSKNSLENKHLLKNHGTKRRVGAPLGRT